MKVLVTGGSGFLGTEICRQLTARGTGVRSLSRRPSAVLNGLAVEQHRGDLRDPVDVARALEGCDAVVHNAALAGVSGPLRPYWETNVDGACNVIRMCRAQGVRTLVHTSTASVVFRPGGLAGVDERCPYPARHLAAYPLTKARAESLVLAANGPGLATCSLRPHIIWGPGDPHFAPALSRAVRRERLLMPGDGRNLVDTTHLRTAAHAHLLALDALHERQSPGGRAYFVTQNEPLPLRGFVTRLLRAVGERAEWRSVPAGLAYGAAALSETAARVTGRTHELSRLLVAELRDPHWFDTTAAHRDLGFTAPLSFTEGMRELEHLCGVRPPPGPRSGSAAR